MKKLHDLPHRAEKLKEPKHFMGDIEVGFHKLDQNLFVMSYWNLASEAFYRNISHPSINYIENSHNHHPANFPSLRIHFASLTQQLNQKNNIQWRQNIFSRLNIYFSESWNCNTQIAQFSCRKKRKRKKNVNQSKV